MAAVNSDDRQQAIDAMVGALKSANDPELTDIQAIKMATQLVDEAIRRRGDSIPPGSPAG
jgi:hypothetical protein